MSICECLSSHMSKYLQKKMVFPQTSLQAKTCFCKYLQFANKSSLKTVKANTQLEFKQIFVNIVLIHFSISACIHILPSYTFYNAEEKKHMNHGAFKPNFILWFLYLPYSAYEIDLVFSTGEP